MRVIRALLATADVRRAADRDQRGAVAVIVAILMTSLLSVGALTIDYGQASLVRRQTQNAADAAARSIAERCAKAATTSTGSSGGSFSAACRRMTTDENALLSTNASSSALNALTGTDRTVTVTVDKRVRYTFAQLLGQYTRTVKSSATAEWTNQRPTEGYPVLPLGVSYCTWKNRSAAAGTATESAAVNRVALRTDPLQKVRDLTSPLSGLLGSTPADSIMNSLGTTNRDTCSDVDGTQLTTLQGAVWLTGETVASDTLRGLFGYEATPCKMRISNTTSMYVGALEGSLVVPQACYNRIGPGLDVDIDKTILLPIYKPANPQGLIWSGASKLGLKTRACTALLSTNQTCLTYPPQIGVTIVGYAPFHVTGYLYPGKDKRDATTACSTNTVSLTIDGILSIIGGIANLVLRAVLKPLGSGQTASISCNGLQGYFTKSFTKDPNFTYGTTGPDLGSGFVRLSN